MTVKNITISALLAAALFGCHKKPAGEGEHHHHDEAAASVTKPAKKFATD